MQFNDTYTPNFIKTNAILKTAVLGGAGWEAKVINPEVLTALPAFGYVWDQSSNWIWMFSAAREAFQNIPEMIKADPEITSDAIYDTFSTLIKRASIGELQHSEAEHWEAHLSNSLLAYSGTTKTWELANQLRDGGHFVVMRYQGKNGKGYLRPFCLSATGSDPLSFDKLSELISHIYEVDRENHPEWFS